jgi:hypothetical protein
MIEPYGSTMPVYMKICNAASVFAAAWLQSPVMPGQY